MNKIIHFGLYFGASLYGDRRCWWLLQLRLSSRLISWEYQDPSSPPLPPPTPPNPESRSPAVRTWQSEKASTDHTLQRSSESRKSCLPLVALVRFVFDESRNCTGGRALACPQFALGARIWAKKQRTFEPLTDGEIAIIYNVRNNFLYLCTLLANKLQDFPCV